SSNVLAIGSMIFAAGVFTGILTGTKMVDEMAISLVYMIPEQMGGLIPAIVALTSGIFTFLMPNDAYFYGVLPILSETAVGVSIDDHQKFALKWAVLAVIVMTAIALLIGAISISV
ncbi:citrate transporter, partial [Lactobacillus delbrueckii subsp. bulgaricus]